MLLLFRNKTSEAPSAEPELIDMELIIGPGDLAAEFDQIEIWRAELSEAGPFVEVTAGQAMAARLPPDDAAPRPRRASHRVDLVGKRLNLVIGETEPVSIEFFGTDPLSFEEAAAQVTAQGKGRVQAHVDSAGGFVVTTTGKGSGASLRVAPSEAALVLALPFDTAASGREARIALVAGQQAYRFMDRLGARRFFYKARARSSTTGAVGSFSRVFSADAPVSVDPRMLVRGVLRLVDQAGRPIQGREVRVTGVFTGRLIQGALAAGVDLAKRTDRTGRVEFALLRGERVTVVIVGTNLVRDVVPPSDPNVSSFDLLGSNEAITDDYFTARAVDQPFAARRFV